MEANFYANILEGIVKTNNISELSKDIIDTLKVKIQESNSISRNTINKMDKALGDVIMVSTFYMNGPLFDVKTFDDFETYMLSNDFYILNVPTIMNNDLSLYDSNSFDFSLIIEENVLIISYKRSENKFYLFCNKNEYDNSDDDKQEEITNAYKKSIISNKNKIYKIYSTYENLLDITEINFNFLAQTVTKEFSDTFKYVFKFDLIVKIEKENGDEGVKGNISFMSNSKGILTITISSEDICHEKVLLDGLSSHKFLKRLDTVLKHELLHYSDITNGAKRNNIGLLDFMDKSKRKVDNLANVFVFNKDDDYELKEKIIYFTNSKEIQAYALNIADFIIENYDDIPKIMRNIEKKLIEISKTKTTVTNIIQAYLKINEIGRTTILLGKNKKYNIDGVKTFEKLKKYIVEYLQKQQQEI